MANALAVAGPNSKFQQPDAKPAGFWAGLWHGIILPITFIIRLFNPNVGIYELNKTAGGTISASSSAFRGRLGAEAELCTSTSSFYHELARIFTKILGDDRRNVHSWR